MSILSNTNDESLDALLFPAMSQQMHALNNQDGSRSKVPRQDFVWTRLKMAGTSTHGPLIIKEKPSEPLFNMMLDMEGDRIDGASYQRMEAYERSMKQANWVRNVYFEQKDFSEHIKSLEEASGWKYEGQVKIGRAYTSSPLPYFKKAIVNTLYKSTHLEVDIKSSYATMLWNAFGQDGDMPFLEKLALDPEELYGDIFDQHGVERGDFKTAVLAMIGAFPSDPATFGLGDDEMDTVRRIGELPFITGFRDDLNTLAVKMNAKYAGFMGTMAHYADKTGKLDHVGGVAMSLFAGDMEHEAMRVVINELCGSKPENIVWKFDGVIVPQDLISDDKIGAVERKVLDKTGIQLKLGVKSLHQPSFPISLGPQEASEDGAYKAWKKKHEKTYFYCNDPPGFVRICPNGTIQHLKQCDYNLQTAPQPAEFNKRWITDPSRRTYERLDYVPPPRVCPPGIFNTYHGMAAESLDDVPADYSIELYTKHVWLLSGANDGHANYIHKLIAHKFQNPAEIWRVMLFFRSTPGVGKDIFFDFLAAAMGKENTVKVVKLNEVMGNQTHRLANKLLGCITEFDYKDGSSFSEELKDRITSRDLVVKQKYVNDYETSSSICLMGFTNNFSSLSFQSDDRRFFPVTCDGRYANNPEYFGPLIEWMSKPESQRAVYNYYMAMDITGFDPSGDRPITETFKSMASTNISLVEIVIKNSFEMWIQDAHDKCNDISFQGNQKSHLRVPPSIPLDLFQERAKDMQMNGADSKFKMAQFQGKQMEEFASKVRRFSHMDRDVVSLYRSNGKRYRVFEIEAIRSWIESIKTENDVEDDDVEENSMLIVPQR